MPIDLHFAPNARELITPFAKELHKSWQDPFAPPKMIVPNPAVGKWLQLRLLDSAQNNAPFQGLLGLDIDTLEQFLWSNLQGQFKGEKPLKRLDKNALTMVLIAQLEGQLLDTPVFGQARKFLQSEQGTLDFNKLEQLATQMATLFLEYEFNRPGVWDSQLENWRQAGLESVWEEKNQPYFDGDEQEEWQRILYRETLQKFQESEDLWLTLPKLHRAVRNQSKNNCWKSTEGQKVFLFQVAQISHFHRNALIEISENANLHVFLTNPCAEFWEDVRHGQRATRTHWNSTDPCENQGIPPRTPADYQREELPLQFTPEEDHELLSLWGQSGKENIYLWCPAGDWQFTFHQPSLEHDPAKDLTLLAKIQESLLLRSNRFPTTASKTPCASFQVFAAPNPRREVEALHAKILEALEENPERQLEDIVIYLAEPEKYLSAIEGVFNAWNSESQRRIPYHLLGIPGKDSLFAQGVLALIHIFEGAFDRSSLFRLLQHPILLANLDITHEDLPILEKWADETGMFRAFDQKHRKHLGDHPSTLSDAHTFGLGVSRLLLGELSSGPTNLGYTIEVEPYRDFHTSDKELLASFVAFLTKIHQQSLQFLEKKHSPIRWAELFTECLKTWFPEIPPEIGKGRSQELRIEAEFLQSLKSFPLLEDIAEKRELTGNEFFQILKNLLPTELPAGSKAWTGGLTIAPLRHGFVLPHRIVAVVGLNGGAYPGILKQSSLDLLQKKRIIGDSDSVRNNRFAFLEILHAAKEKLFLSYEARNMQKEESLQAASVLLELVAWVQKNDPTFAIQNIQWLPWESQGASLGEELWDETIHTLKNLPPKAVLDRPYHPNSLKHPRTEAQTPKALAEGRFLTFIKNPLESHLRHGLQLRNEEDFGTQEHIDEPLESAFLPLIQLQQKVYIHILNLLFNEDISEEECHTQSLGFFDQQFKEHCFFGAGPEGFPAKSEEQNFKEKVLTFLEHSTSLKKEFPTHQFCKGPTYFQKTSASHTLHFPNPKNPKDPVYQIELKGTMALLPQDTLGPIVLFSVNHKSKFPLGENFDFLCKALLHSLRFPKQEILLVQINRTAGELEKKFLHPSLKSPAKQGELRQWIYDRLEEIHGEIADNFPLPLIHSLVKNKKGPLAWEKLTPENLQAAFEDDFPAYRCSLDAFQLIEKETFFKNSETLIATAQQRYGYLLEGGFYE